MIPGKGNRHLAGAAALLLAVACGGPAAQPSAAPQSLLPTAASESTTPPVPSPIAGASATAGPSATPSASPEPTPTPVAAWSACPSAFRDELSPPEPVRLEPGDTLRITQSVELPGTPSFLAYGATSVWATGVEGELWRVDAATGELLDEITAGTDPFIWPAFGHDSVWFGRPAEGVLVRLDPDTNEKIEIELAPGDRPMAIAFDDASTWVASQSANRLYRIDAQGNRVVLELDLRERGPIDAGPSGLGVLDGMLWVSEHRSDSVARYDPSTGKTDRACLGTPSPGRMAVTDDAVWIAEIGGLLTRVNPATLTVTDRLEVPGVGIGELAARDGEVWMGNGTYVVMYDTVSGTSRAIAMPELSPTSESPGGLAIAVGPEAVWATDPSGDRLLRIEIAD